MAFAFLMNADCVIEYVYSCYTLVMLKLLPHVSQAGRPHVFALPVLKLSLGTSSPTKMFKVNTMVLEYELLYTV